MADNVISKIKLPDNQEYILKDSDAARSNHTHDISLEKDTSGTNQLTLAAGTKYKLTAGGESYIFTTPADANNKVTIAADTTTNANYPLVFGSTNTSTTTAKTEGLQKSTTKFYVNPSTGNIQATTFNGIALTAAAGKSITDNSSNADVTSSDTNLITGRTLYYQLAKKGYTTNTGTVTSITLKAGNGITLDTDNTPITTSGSRTISVSYGTSASAIGITSSAGTANTVSRSDHTHKIEIDEGTNNGEISIAGVTVKPKGIAALAYKASLVAGDIPNLAWSKITSGKPTTLSGYGITDAKIDGGVITLGSNTITPVTSVNGHTGNVVNVTAGDLGLSSALRYVGKTTSTMSESFTGVPAGISGYTKPIVGDVVLDSAGNGEYLCIAVNGTTYTWESLGSESSFKKVQTAVSSPSTGDSAQIEFIDTISQDVQGVISATKQPVRIASKTQTGVIQITKDNTNLFLNTLDTGSSTPTDNDYYISQYVGGGTTTTTYHRRPVSALYSYIKSKTDTLYPTKAGGGATGTWGISISGNAATATTATKFASAQSVTLTGDTTGTKSSQAGWSIPTITSKMSGLGRKSTVESIAINQTTDIGGKLAWNIYDSSARNADAENTPSFDASVINIPWDWGAYNGQIAISSTSGTTPRMQIRTANSKDNGDGANPRYTPLYTAWREIVTAPKDSAVGGTTQPVYINNIGQVVPGTALGTAAYKATGDFATSGHNHDSTYLKLTGGTMSGNILGNATATLGSTTNPWHQLVLGGATSATVTSASTNPRITFQESNNGSQPVHLIYSDYDNYRAPAGLKVVGGTSANPAWFEVEGNIYAAAFKGNADTAGEISGKNPTIAASTENNEVKIIDLGNTIPVAGAAQRHALDFRWYDSHWAIGNLRSGNTESSGFGFSFSNDGGTSYSNLVTISTEGRITATAFSGSLDGNATSATTATNLANKPSIVASGNNITITAGGKTSDAFTVPYATTAATATKLNQSTISSLSTFKDDNALIYSSAVGSNSIADKPTGVDAFGVLSCKTAAGWFGQILISSDQSSNIYWRTNTSLSGGWKTLLDTSNYATTLDNTYVKKANGVTAITWDSANNKLTRTINGTASDVVTLATIKTALGTMTPSSHAHGNITNGGTITSTAVALANGDNLLFADSSNSGKIERSSITIGTATNTWLCNNGTWTTPTAAQVGAVALANGVTAVTWDSTNKKITRTINGTAAEVVAFEGTAPITVTGAANKLTIAHSGNSGYKHIPSGGSSGQFLGWDSDGTAKWVANPNTDTKVTSVGNHYTPAADTNSELSASASGATAAWSIDVVKAVQLQRDAKGHVTGVTVTSGKIPANPNTDTKVTNTLATTTKYYVTGTTSTTTNTGGQSFDTGVYVTTTAGEFSAVRHSYNVAGVERAYTHYNMTDQSIDFVFV